MDHMQMLCVKSQESEGEISGHALMATCPPESHLIQHPDVQYPHKMPDMHAGDLLKLLDLSNRLPLDGEITPVMAWAFVLKDPRVRSLSKDDFLVMKTDLLAKVRCYGSVWMNRLKMGDIVMLTFPTSDLARCWKSSRSKTLSRVSS